jgi:hypothetical protein
MGLSGFRRQNAFVSGSLTGTGRVSIDCQDATQVWARVHGLPDPPGSFVATYQPEVNADPTDDALWTKVDIWELETRRLFSTSSGGRVFTFSDLLGAARASIKVTAYTSGTVGIELRALRTGTPTGRDTPYPEAVMSAYGAVVAPAAGVAIATIADPGEGIYEVTVAAYYPVGAVAAAEDSNLELRSGATVVGRIPMVRALNVVSTHKFQFVNVTSSTNDLTVNATGAATGGVAYNVHLYAQRLV